MKDGFGEEEYYDGSRYIGQFKENKKNGEGNLILVGGDGESLRGYSGEFRNDKIWGKGKFIWNDNKEYIGDWVNDEITGYGIIREGKLKHLGFFEHNLKEGIGATFYDEQNFVLSGKWENNLIEGYGILINLEDKDKNNNNIDANNNNEIIVKMGKGEIINKSLDEDEINKFKKSEEYGNIIELYKEKFYPDYIKYMNNKNIF